MSTYLILYNAASWILWAYIGQVLLTHLPYIGTEHAFHALLPPVRAALFSACLENLHAVLGLVKSGLAPTLMQTLVRLFILYGVCDLLRVPTAVNSPIFSLMCAVWTIAELVRYGYYLQQLVEGPESGSSLLKWARYTLFYVLYPIGAGGEAYMLYASLGQIALTWGSGAYYASQAALSIYILGLAMMMGYMHKQRRRHLHPKPKPAPSPKKSK